MTWRAVIIHSNNSRPAIPIIFIKLIHTINPQYFCELLDSNSLKTVFSKIPTANYIHFLIDVIIKKKLFVLLRVLNLWNSSYLSWFIFSKQPKIEKTIARFHTEWHFSKFNLLRRGKDIIRDSVQLTKYIRKLSRQQAQNLQKDLIWVKHREELKV